MNNNIIKTLKNEENLTAAGGMNGEEIREAAKTLGVQIDDKVSNEDLEKNLKLGTEKIKAMNDDEIKSSLESISGGSKDFLNSTVNNIRSAASDSLTTAKALGMTSLDFAKKIKKPGSEFIDNSTEIIAKNFENHPVFCTGIAAAMIGGTYGIAKGIKALKNRNKK